MILLEQMATILGRAVMGFPNFTISREFIHAWHQNFQLCDVGKFAAALTAATNEPGRQFFPTYGDIQTYLLKSERNAAEAWELAVGAAKNSLDEAHLMNEFGEESLLFRTIMAVGWSRIRYANIEKELDFIRKEFLRFYKELEEGVEKRDVFAIGREQSKQILGRIGLNGIKTIT